MGKIEAITLGRMEPNEDEKESEKVILKLQLWK
jgi:hypothetical protein